MRRLVLPRGRRGVTFGEVRTKPFADRVEAGRLLGERLVQLQLDRPVLLALPRGGVPVAYEAARVLGAEMDVFIGRKVGAPGHREYGIGAVAEGGVVVADAEALRLLGVSSRKFEELAAVEQQELERRVAVYRRGRAAIDVRDRHVVLIDDGLATGVTAQAALLAVRALEPGRLILAAPVGASDTVTRLATIADEVVCLLKPADFAAVGQWYVDFDQTSDEEVLRLLDRANPSH
jgi:putative phosphoribosyl transferase